MMLLMSVDFLNAVRAANLVMSDSSNYSSKFIALNRVYDLFELCSESLEERNYVGSRLVASYFFKPLDFKPLLDSLVADKVVKFSLSCVYFADRACWDNEFLYSESSCRVEVQVGVADCVLRLDDLLLSYVVEFKPRGVLFSESSDFSKSLSSDVISGLMGKAVRSL